MPPSPFFYRNPPSSGLSLGHLLLEVPLTLPSLGVQSQHHSIQNTAHPLLMVLEVGLFLPPLVSAPGSVSLPGCLPLSTLMFISVTKNTHWHLPVRSRSVEGRRAKEAGWHGKHRKELGRLVLKKARWWGGQESGQQLVDDCLSCRDSNTPMRLCCVGL